ncbi:MAG: transposase, partial [Flavobacteriaceae bacterium]|nr:transposase [Flavobacteriaceae bacterium]
MDRLSAIGNPLEAINKVIDFELFRELLECKLLNTNKKNNAGAKPYDVLMLFKILILQRYYGLGDSQVEYQILDRTSFKTFLGLETGDKVPDEK